MLTELTSAVVTIQLCPGGKKEHVPSSPLYQVEKLMELWSHLVVGLKDRRGCVLLHAQTARMCK